MKRAFSFRRSLSQALRLPLAGPVFKLYAPRRRWEARDSEPRRLRVLIANLMPSLGDTVCYMPVAEVLAAAVPNVEITWLADSAMAGLVEKHPNVTRVLTVKTPETILKRMPTIKMYFRLYTLMRTVMGMELPHRFDIAIIPRGGVDPSLSAQAVWMLNLSRSVGYSHLIEPEDVDHNFGDHLITDLVRHPAQLHEAARAMSLLESCNIVPDVHRCWDMSMPVRGIRAIAESIDADSVFAKTSIPRHKPFMIVCPGAGVPNRAWSARNFHNLCSEIVDKTDLTIALTGTAAEIGLAREVALDLEERVFNCAGKLSLSELIALISHSVAFVGNDSGAGHIAGPLGIPTISLHTQAEGSNPAHIRAPEHGRPLGPFVTVIQPASFLSPCRERCEAKGSHCIDQITVDQVWTALTSALNLEPKRIPLNGCKEAQQLRSPVAYGV
jgi:ADP-heptose:LPS heptosyltransferase